MITLGFSGILHAQSLTPLEDGLKSPSNSDLKRVQQLKEIGSLWWWKNQGLLAEERFKVDGYFFDVRPIKDFADQNDKIWEVRVIHIGGNTTGILWINEKTQKIISLGPNYKIAEQNAAANP